MYEKYRLDVLTFLKYMFWLLCYLLRDLCLLGPNMGKFIQTHKI